MAQDWELPPEWQQAQPIPPPPLDPAQLTSSQMNAAHELRPLSLGEVLDRTFSLYRSRFWLFAGLASLTGAVSLVLSLLQLLVHHLVLVHSGFAIAQLEVSLARMVIGLLELPVTAVVYAASVFALCEIYLGREIDAKAALKATIGRWLRYVGISLWWGWSAVWLPALVLVPAVMMVALAPRLGVGMELLGGLLGFVGFFGGGVYAVIAYIRNSLAIPAALMENTGVRASMRRSKTLAKGTKGRIFVVLLIAFVLYMVPFSIMVPIGIVIARTPLEEHVLAQAVILAISFLAQTLVSPVALIGLTLVYFDQRVRHEAFDLLIMMGPDATPVEAQPLVWPPTAPEAAAWPPPPAPAPEAAVWPPPPPSYAGITTPPIAAEPILATPIVAEPPTEPPPPPPSDPDAEKPL